MTDQENNNNNNNSDDWVYVYGKGVPPLTKARCNVRLLVDERHARFYAAAAKSEQRRAIVDEIMHIVIEHNGGRFLKRQSDGSLLDVEPRIVRAHLQTMFSDKTRVAARRDRQQRLSPVLSVASSQPMIAEHSSVQQRAPAQLKDDTVASETSNLADAHHLDGDPSILLDSSEGAPSIVLDKARLERDGLRLESQKNANDDLETTVSGQDYTTAKVHRSESSPAIPPPHRDVTESAGASLSPNSIRAGRESHEQDHLGSPGNQIDPTHVAPGPRSARQTSATTSLMDLMPPLPLRECHVESAALQSQCDNSRSPLAPNSVYVVLRCKCDNLRCSRTFSVCQFGSDIVCPYCNLENRRMAGVESSTKNVPYMEDGRRGRSSRRHGADLLLGNNSRGGNGAQQGNSNESSNSDKASQRTVASSGHSRCERSNSTRLTLVALSNEDDEGSAISRKVNVDKNDEDTAQDVIMSDVLPGKSPKDDYAANEKTTKKLTETMACNDTFMGGLGVLAATAAMTRRDAETDTVESGNSSATDQYSEQDRRHESELVFVSGSTKQQDTHQASGESTQSIDVPPLTEREVN